MIAPAVLPVIIHGQHDKPVLHRRVRVKLLLDILCRHAATGVRATRLREHPQNVCRSAFQRLRDFLKVRVPLANYDAYNALWCSAVKVARKPSLRMTSQPSSQSCAPT